MEKFIALDFDLSELSFALRSYDPPRNVHAEKRSKTSSEVKAAVLQSPRMKRVMRNQAKTCGCEVQQVEKEVKSLLNEIGHQMTLPTIRTLACLLRGVLRKVLAGIYVNEDGLARLMETETKWPVLLLPSHRSYLDFVLVSYVMFEHNLPLPCIAAGLDFMAMKGVSSLLRGSGAFFLRRTFGSDKLYKAAFSEYVQEILYSRDYPMEFFVEGTRSRTGKSLHPRLGLLSMVIEPYLEGRLPDIMMVPISISYERTLEEWLFAREQLGVPKPKESTTGLFQAYSLLTESYGNIFVNIGDPISVHSVCQRCAVSRIPHSLLPRETSVLMAEERHLVKELGHEVMDKLHDGMFIFPTSLVATALLQDSSKALTFNPLVVTKEGLQMLSGTINWTSDLIKIATSKLDRYTSPPVKYHVEEIFQWKLDTPIFQALLDQALNYVVLAHYRNQLLHLFVLDSLLAISLDAEILHGTALQIYLTLFSALTCEFVLPQRNCSELFDEGVDSFVKRGIIASHYTSDEKRLLSERPSDNNNILLYFLRNLLQPFLSSVWVLCQQLLSLDEGVQSLSAAVKGTQLLAAKYICFGVVSSFEVLSLSLIRNAITSLHHAGLILQASSEFETGQDHLVKVVDKQKLCHFAQILGNVSMLKEKQLNSNL